MNSEAIRLQHAALTGGAGFADVSNRSQVEIAGKDRAQLLHGLCTNDIKGLEVGGGCETFLTNVQGKTIGYLNVFRCPETLVLDSVPGETASIIRNLDRYVIREDVRFRDLGSEQTEFLVSGAAAPSCLLKMLGVESPAAPLHHFSLTWHDRDLSLRRVPITGADCFLLAISRENATSFSAALAAAGMTLCEDAAVEVARIEGGTPFFNKDVTEDNLPQEVDRTPQAISFKKGCYLGQETVARLDAMGHVNRTLCGLRWFGHEIPAPGSEIRSDGKLVARVTSACWSERLDAPLALAYVKRGLNQPATRFPSPWGEAEVVRLPLV